MARSISLVLTILCLAALLSGGATAGTAKSSACAGQKYSYAGLESATTAHGVSATIAPRRAPRVTDGHVAGWIGLGGAGPAPRHVVQWLQVGFAAITDDRASRIYYEVVKGSKSTLRELDKEVLPGEKHRLAVLEMAGRKSWWRVWVDGKPVSPPIHLAGSHGTWYPQAIAENFNGAYGTCNGYAFEFSELAVARTGGGAWRPFTSGHVFQDRGYRVVRGATATRFLATSL